MNNINLTQEILKNENENTKNKLSQLLESTIPSINKNISDNNSTLSNEINLVKINYVEQSKYNDLNSTVFQIKNEISTLKTETSINSYELNNGPIYKTEENNIYI